MSFRIFIGSPVVDHEQLILQTCQEVQHINPVWRIVQPSSWHVTYAFPGNVSEEALMEAMDVTELIAQEFEPYTLEPDRFLFMPEKNPSMLWLRMKLNPSFERLFEAFHRELNLRPSHAPNPHVTIMRGNAKRLVSTSLPEVDTAPLKQLFSGINIYRSHLQPGGSRYEVIRSRAMK